MKKTTAQTSVPPQYPVTITRGVDSSVVIITINKILIPDSTLLPDNILYKPACYLQKEGNLSYALYAFVSVPLNSSVNAETTTAERINATNYVTLGITPSASADAEMLLYVTVTGLPAPMGFQLSTLIFTVIGGDGIDDNTGGPKEGQGRTAVSYQDADDLPA